MVQSLSISVGNANSYVAAGQGGGIEILLNEYSNRSTPSMVAFTDQYRAIGVDASMNLFMNLENTVYDLMILLGKPYKDIRLEDSNGKPIYPFKLEESSNGQAQVVVKHLGKERKFTITQILAMLFTKLRGIAGDSVDCVLSCPQFYTDSQKSALVQAALVAGLNPLQVITDMSAVILNYAYYRTTKAESHKFVAFVNFGQSNLQTVVAWLSPKDDVVRVLACESEPLGGRDFDRCIAEHFIKTHKLNLSQKASLKLISASEKLKRLLSASINETPINIESLLGEDKDFTSRMDRATFEGVAQPILKSVDDCLRRTLATAKANYDHYLREKAKLLEAQAAQDAEMTDSQADASGDAKTDDPKAAEANQDPAVEEPESKMDVSQTAEASQTEKTDQPQAAEAEKDVDKAANQPAADVKTSKSPSNTKNAKKTNSKPVEVVEDPLEMVLQAVEIIGGSSRIPAVRQLVQDVFNLVPSTTLNTDEAVARGCLLHCATLHPGMKVKREVRVLNVEAFLKPSNMSCDKDFRRVELELITEDRKYRARTEARNNLEEYIYSERSKLQEGDEYLQKLSDTLDWLFNDEGENSTEEIYIGKLADLRKISQDRIAAVAAASQKTEVPNNATEAMDVAENKEVAS